MGKPSEFGRNRHRIFHAHCLTRAHYVTAVCLGYPSPIFMPMSCHHRAIMPMPSALAPANPCLPACLPMPAFCLSACLRMLSARLPAHVVCVHACTNPFARTSAPARLRQPVCAHVCASPSARTSAPAVCAYACVYPSAHACACPSALAPTRPCLHTCLPTPTYYLHACPRTLPISMSAHAARLHACPLGVMRLSLRLCALTLSSCLGNTQSS